MQPEFDQRFAARVQGTTEVIFTVSELQEIGRNAINKAQKEKLGNTFAELKDA
jgi:hypothetical protein